MRKALPAKYYLDHFREFLAFFRGANGRLLDIQSREFIGDFYELTEPEQCIIARAATRKYGLINRTHFNYDEIPQPQDQIDSLIADGWFGDIAEAARWDLAGMLTKADIVHCLNICGCTGFSNNEKKAALINLLFRQVAISGWPEELQIEQYLYCRFDPVIRFLLLLYFGNTKGRLNQFSMRDLGIMRTRGNASDDETRFDSKDDAQAAFFYAYGEERLAFMDVNEIIDQADEPLPLAESVISQHYAQKYCLKVAAVLLKEKPQQGLHFLQRAPGELCKEKWVREAYKDGQKEAVRAELEAIISSPSSDGLLAFAEDFYQRKFHKKRTSVVTDMLRNAARSLSLDERYNQSVEQGVMAWYKRQGILSWRTENRLWRSLFALTFWTPLFEKDTPVTEFDSRPKTLKNNTFYDVFKDEIELILTTCIDSEQLMKHVTAVAAAHYGEGNSLFLWGAGLLEPIKALLAYADFDCVVALLRVMAQDFSHCRDGFPDIMVCENGKLRFEEVKAPGDQLRRNQLVTIQKMQQCGFDVQITQVAWCRDPDQPYVVVDIETTGGNSQFHRITEVGMVKLVRGEVVDEWQSLVNPGRHIPSAITRLTGITNDMVANAPTFADLAQEIECFTEGAIFVAHNVNFDYGFIKQEFARLEQTFKRPKLCTVRESRKAHPGLPSYSLAALTAHFNIDMQQHHRALSDAKAAAQLLLLAQQSQPQRLKVQV